MSGPLFQLPKVVPLSTTGGLLAGAKLNFYAASTSTRQNTYQDAALTTPHANPVVADANGVFAPIYLDPALGDYKTVLTTSADVVIYTVDNIASTFSSATLALSLNSLKRTAAEIAAAVTPSDYSYAPGDIRRYGAVGDDSTDCTTAITNAIAQHVNGGPAVYLPTGTYRLTSQISIANPVTIYGDGYGSVLKCASAQTFIFLLVEGASSAAVNGVRFTNFRIDANGSGQLDAGIIQLNNAVGFDLESLWISGASRASGAAGVNGIAVSAGTLGGTAAKGSITDCYITGCSKAGINWTTESVGGYIAGNIIHSNTGNGSSPGIQINGGYNGKVIGNEVYNNQGPGIYMATDGNSRSPRYAIIEGNHVYSNGQGTSQGEGISLANATATVFGRVIIRGNHVYSNGVNITGGAAGILIQNDEHVLCEGNYVYGNYGSGITVQESTNTVRDVLIANNIIENNNIVNAADGTGVYVDGDIERLVIRGNKFVDNQGTATQDWAVRFSSSGAVTDLTIEHNSCEGHTNAGNYSLDAGTTFRRMRLSLDWRLQTTNGTNTNGPAITLPDDAAVLVKSHLLAMTAGGANRAGYERVAVVYRDGGGATLQGSVAAPVTVESDAAWDHTLVVGGNAFAPQVTGAGATTIDWRGRLEALSL